MVKDWVLGPSGISNMEMGGSTSPEKKQNEAVYYGGFPYSYNVPRMDAHGGWIATPIDLLRFLTHADGFASPEDLILPGTWNMMVTQNPVAGNTVGYAKGWVNWGSGVGVNDGIIWHDGGF